MFTVDSLSSRIIFSLLVVAGLLYIPAPVMSQDDPALQNVVLNGDFEEGFQPDFGIGYGWGGFSNGQAVIGWQSDSWDKVVVSGQNAQMIEIKESTAMDRYAGIYQTVAVVPGEQYKLTINGLIRSAEGNIAQSDYGYRLQYAIDDQGGTAWELAPDTAWVELPWDEQSLTGLPESSYQRHTYETTLTAKSDRLTLFIRGWKKWINSGSGIFNLDAISLVGPAPAGFKPVAVEAAAVPAAESPAEPADAAKVQAATPVPPDPAPPGPNRPATRVRLWQ
jgi:hypothetical protein